MPKPDVRDRAAPGAFHHAAILVFESRNADGAGPFDHRRRDRASTRNHN